MKTETTLITGCTSGIGLHLAHEFARNGHPLVLVAPVEDELQQLRQELSAVYGITAHVIAKDLENPDSPQQIFDTLENDGVTIDILANNAGHGFHGKFWEQSIENHLSIIRLNIEAVVKLTGLFLPLMVSRGKGRIFNTASVAGFEPGPLVAIYHASKAFVLSWSEALSVELKDTGVSVTALCPGATDTDFFEKADMIDVKAVQKGRVMSPQDVAKAGYKGLMDNELIVIPGVANKMLVMGRRFLTEEAQAKLNGAQYERVPPDELKFQRGDKEHEATLKS